MLFNLFNDAIIKHPKVAALVLFVVYILPMPSNTPFYIPTITHYAIFFCIGYVLGYEVITPPPTSKTRTIIANGATCEISMVVHEFY
jgi:hypothetical protein